MAGQIEPIARMAQQLSRLPGIGAKTAQRLAYHIVSLPEDQVHELASAIWQGRKAVKYCSICGNYTVEDPCPICADEKLGVSFYDGCDNNFNKMIAKMKGVDKAAEDYRFTIFYDPDTDTYWVDNSLELFFENQEDVIARYLKENGYQLISMTGEK